MDISVTIERQEKVQILRRFLMIAYGLSEGDVEVFLKVAKMGSTDVETLSSEVRISKSRISLILKKLNDAGLLEKTKVSSQGGGRPKYVYEVLKDEVKEKMLRRSQELCLSLKSAISEI